MNANRVWAEIDLDALTHNLRVIRRHAGPGVRLMLVVKADAYGHGAVAVAHHAVRCGVTALGVGTSHEALELRAAGLRVPILVLGTILQEESAALLRHGVEIGIHASDRVAQLDRLGRRLRLKARVHLNVDTGMGRLGVLPGQAPRLLEAIQAAPCVELAGLMTHISSPRGGLAPGTNDQIEAFLEVLRCAERLGLQPESTHVANSATLFTGVRGPFDTVRPGISAYGILPAELPGAAELLPVMSLRSSVVFLKDLPVGAPVGYDSAWTAQRPTRIATLPIGYNDGLPWRLSGKGEALIRGHSAPILGRISMDYTTIDVTDIPGVKVGDAATFLGRDGDQCIPVEELARRAGTIPYEITCSIGKRVQRVPVGGGLTTPPLLSSDPGPLPLSH
ncbi:MAG: alanine racemase [Planctomycetes bacterium]|nr:alanine racemase [Planctomycetota bacterium]MCB9903464.1 alanine racemase [Planctomycetota bacterium]